MKLILRWKDPVPKFYQIIWPTWYTVNQRASQVAWVIKNPPASTGDMRDMGSIPGLGRSPGGGLGNPLQYSCLKNSTDRASRPATVQRLANSLFTRMHSSTNQSKQCFLKQPLNPLQCYVSVDSRHWEEKRQILSSLSSDSHCSQTEHKGCVCVCVCVRERARAREREREREREGESEEEQGRGDPALGHERINDRIMSSAESVREKRAEPFHTNRARGRGTKDAWMQSPEERESKHGTGRAGIWRRLLLLRPPNQLAMLVLSQAGSRQRPQGPFHWLSGGCHPW